VTFLACSYHAATTTITNSHFSLNIYEVTKLLLSDLWLSVILRLQVSDLPTVS